MKWLILASVLFFTSCSYTAYPDWVYYPKHRVEVFIPQPRVGYSFYNRYAYSFNPYLSYRPINPYFHYLYSPGSIQIWSNAPLSFWNGYYYNDWRYDWHYNWQYDWYIRNSIVRNYNTVNVSQPQRPTDNRIVAPRRTNTNNYLPRRLVNPRIPVKTGPINRSTIKTSPIQRRVEPNKTIQQTRKPSKNTVIYKKQSVGKRTGNNNETY